MTILLMTLTLATVLFLSAMTMHFRALARLPRPTATPARPVVARLARGNVLLQAGRYATAERTSARVARLRGYRFVD